MKKPRYPYRIGIIFLLLTVPPIGATHADVLREAHLIMLELGDYNINQKHIALAIEKLSKSMRPSLSK